MKGQLDNESTADTPEMEPVYEEWTEEMLRQRSKELQLIDEEGNIRSKVEASRIDRIEEVIFSDHEQSPSKSTTTESQVSL